MTRRELLAASVAVTLNREGLDRAVALIEDSVRSGKVSAAALHVHGGTVTLSRGFGRAHGPDTIFLLASITKPMTVTAVMMLVDRREVRLSDPVRRYIPEFTGGERDRITVRHLLTHTSGLPDMLRENTELRKRHAPLRDFVTATCKTPLLFSPGTEVRYQSMGILLAAEIVERTTGAPLRAFLREHVFAPLRMERTFLGLDGHKISETALCQVTDDEDWNWNSAYWRDLGAPWGGAHSTAPEVAGFVQYFLEPDGRVLKPETAASMIVNQTAPLAEPWGFGWMVKPGAFGKNCSARTFGHYGATGTIAWADPANGLICVLLTTEPAKESRDNLLGPVSDAVSAAVAKPA